MKLIRIFSGIFLFTIAFLVSAAEVRVCNKSEFVLKNVEVNYWKFGTLNIGDCSGYYKNPLAQQYVSVSAYIDKKHLSFAPKKTSLILEEGRYSYEISVVNEGLHLETVKN
jgi:hypothetical protein